MKRNLLAGASFAIAGLAFIVGEAVRGQPGPGPGDDGAVLKQPWQTTSPVIPAPFNPVAPTAKPAPPNNLPHFAQPNPLAPTGVPGRIPGPGLSLPQEGPDPNQDILVTPKEGPWMVLVHWYSGPEASKWAREFVMELRQTYKLPAYVFNRGAEERKKEYERVKGLIEKQREHLKNQNLPIDESIRVRYMRVEEQCGVLVGGYKDEASARRALDQIRKLDGPDHKKIKLHTSVSTETVGDPKEGKVEAVLRPINPFTTAFVTRNPSIKVEQATDWSKEDLEIFRKLNREESFSLLKCTKPFTLAIKQFYTPTAIQPQSSKGTFFEHLGGKSGDRTDTAALNAHNMADVLRKTKFEAYVLHTKCSSIVTVGAFSSPTDPSLLSLQRLLVEQYKVPQATPMQVPGIPYQAPKK